MRAVILYYSRSGNTEKLAKKIQADLDCDMIKIEPTQAYGNYIMSCLRVMGERAKKAVPEFITPIPNLSEYDTVLIGYPIWAQDMPAFVAEFVRRCDLRGKTVIPFATYGMSNIQWTMKTVNAVCPGAEIKYPYDIGVFKKGGYEQWMAGIKTMA